MNIIKEWESAKQIFAYYNIKHSHCLEDCCKGKIHTYKGYIWKYK